jgi:hypothetical protein
VSPCVIRSNCRRPSPPAGAPFRPLAVRGGGNVRTWSREQETRPVSRQANVVGLSTRTRQLLRWTRRRLVARRCMIGDANAAAPVPVWRCRVHRERQERPGWLWIGVGVSQPSACSALRIGVLRPRCKKSANVSAFRRPRLLGCAEKSIRRATPVAWRHPACPGLSDWCLGRSTGGRFRESARSSFTRLERRKSLNRAVTPYFMLRRTSQTRRKPEGHDHKIRCPNGRWP